MNNKATCNQNHVTLSKGVRLRNARKQLGLTQQAVAERLCLKVAIIRDIEEDKAPADLASTFLRGYIRSYAKLVHIPENELLSEASIKGMKIMTIQSFSLSKHGKKGNGWLMSFTCLILFIVIGLTGAWWWQNHKAQKKEIIKMIDDQSSINELSQSYNWHAEHAVRTP